MAQGDITSTEELVEALNNTPPEKQEPLQRWVQQYIKWFNNEYLANLAMNQGQAIHEYRILERIQPNSPGKKQLLIDYFNSLCTKVQESEYENKYLIEALGSALQSIDIKVFQGNPSHFLDLADKLLNRLSASNELPKSTYPTYLNTFLALYSTLVLIHSITSERLDSQKGTTLPTPCSKASGYEK